MIRVFDPGTRSLVAAPALPVAGWVHVSAPTPEELAALRDQLSLPEHFLEHALDPEELARLDREPGGTRLVVLRVPWHPGDRSDVPYRSNTLSVVLRGDHLVTIALGPDEVVEDLLGAEDLDPSRPHRFVLLLLLCTAERFLASLRQVDGEIAAIEEQLQTSLANREVRQLLHYQKGLVHLATAVASDRILLERLQKDAVVGLSEEDRDLLEDVIVEFRQAAETSRVSSDLLANMMDAFASIISNNLNVVMKFLAALTLVLAVPTMVASFWGMNVGLPFAHHPWAFLALVALSAAASVALSAAFARRGWF